MKNKDAKILVVSFVGDFYLLISSFNLVWGKVAHVDCSYFWV